MSDMRTPPASSQAMLRIPRSASPVRTQAAHPSRRLPVLVYVGGSLLLAAGLIVGAQAVGWYGTTGKLDAGTGERVELTAASTSADIKGWMTIQQFLDAFPVTKQELFTRFAIPAGTATSQTLGSLKENGVGTLDIPSLRAWVDTLA